MPDLSRDLALPDGLDASGVPDVPGSVARGPFQSPSFPAWAELAARKSEAVRVFRWVAIGGVPQVVLWPAGIRVLAGLTPGVSRLCDLAEAQS